MEDTDWSNLSALADAEERERVRSMLDEGRRAQFDELWSLLETVLDDPDPADRVAAELLLLVVEALPDWAGSRRTRLATAPSPVRGQPLREVVLAYLFAPGVPEDSAAGPQPHDPQDSVAAIRGRIRSWLLSAPSRPADDAQAAAPDGARGSVIRLDRPEGGSQFPSFQFRPDGEPVPVVLTVNELLGAREDPWGAADWWLGPSLWFPRPPAEMIGRVPDRQLVAAARAAMDGEW